ncbi:LLM class flavin-dependent oxidoreductase [Kineococcus terrestris]|uniref:LLM class flavin-dependent oxidoreductase n=1 Tax=Kineococcus terrestris TaxID=2044856 RepID=UPI0034DAFD81
MTRRIHLNAFDMTCVAHQSPGLWRHPDDQSHRYDDLRYWTDLAKLLERGRFTSLFVADVLGIYDVYRDGPETALREAAQVPVGDPLMAVSAMGAVTEHLGFGLTVSLTYEKPYAFARRMATLDHYTDGRVGWNVVTSYLESAARNLGLETQVRHDQRYELGEEFMEVCYKLWESSWEDDAVVRDAEAGVFTDPAKVHPVGHHGEFFDVPGIGLTAPSPQRTPVIFQAGASPRGIAFAARHGEAVFNTATRPEVMRPWVDRLRAEVAAAGRDPRSVKVFTLVTIITAPTDEEARAKHEEYLRYVSYDGALTLYGGWSGLDLSTYPPDEPLEYAETEAVRSAVEAFSTADPHRRWTPRDIAHHVGIGGMGAVIVGSPATVADELERWMEVGDVDGFNCAYAVTPGTFEDLVELLVPELQRRGVYPEDYEGETLRESVHGKGQVHLRDDHPGARYRASLVHARQEEETR